MIVRKFVVFVVAATTAFAAFPSRVRADSYLVDATHTAVLFSVAHMQPAVSYTYGFFRSYNGNFELDAADPAACQFQFSIDVDSLDTNNGQRDQHLKGPDFFNVRQFPTITFESTSCALATAPNGVQIYNVTGNLTMLGNTRQVTLPMQFVGEATDRGGKRVGFLSQFTIKRSDFGMSNMLDNLGDAVGVTVSFEGTQQADRAGARLEP